jgi:hypothetical protein
MVSYWKIDEGTDTSAADSKGSNTGTLTNSPTWDTDKELPAIQAKWFNSNGDRVDNRGGYEFDGVNDDINCGSDASLDNLSDITVIAWIKPTSETTNDMIVSKIDTVGWWFQTQGSVEEGRIRFSATYNVGSIKKASVGDTLIYDQWNHVAVTWNGTNDNTDIHIYHNGEEVDYAEEENATGTTRDDDSSQSLRIGDWGFGTSNHFNGSIDDARVYEEILSATDIKDHYLSSKEPSTTNLKGHWKLDGNAIDSSGNGNDGTISGAIPFIQFHESPDFGNTLGDTDTLSFDGVNDYISVPNDSSLQITGARSISAWMKFDSLDDRSPIFTKGTSHGTASTNSEYWFGWGASGTSLFFRVSDGTSFIVDLSVATAGLIDIGEWHQISCTWDGTTNANGIKIYIDAVEIASGTATGTTGVTRTDTARRS